MNDCCTYCDRELTKYYILDVNNKKEYACEGCYNYLYVQGFNESEDE